MSSHLKLVSPKRRVSISDQGAIEAAQEHIEDARRCLKLRLLFTAGGHVKAARVAVGRIHDPELKDQWSARCRQVALDGYAAEQDGDL